MSKPSPLKANKSKPNTNSTNKNISNNKSSASTNSTIATPSPNPLFEEYLTPTRPPACATKDQLGLWTSVLTRRTNQLTQLDLKALQTLYKILFENESSSTSSVSKALKSLLQKLPSKKPSVDNRLEYISIIRYTLICRFHISIDCDIIESERVYSLDCVTEILACLDTVYAKFIADRVKKQQKTREVEEQQRTLKLAAQQQKEKELKERERASQLKQLEQNKDQAALAAAANHNLVTWRPTPPATTSNNNSGHISGGGVTAGEATASRIAMGSMGSKTATTATNTSNDKDDDDVIEILEDSPPSSPQRPTPSQLPTTTTTTHQKSDSVSSTTSSSSRQAPPPPPTAPITNATSGMIQPNTNNNITTTTNQQLPIVKKIQRDSVPMKFRKKIIPFTLTFQADILSKNSNSSSNTYSSSLKPRSPCNIKVNLGLDQDPTNTTAAATTSLDGPDIDLMYERFETWDPFWKVIYDAGLNKLTLPGPDGSGVNKKVYEVGLKTARVIQCHMNGNSHNIGGQAPLTAVKMDCMIPMDIIKASSRTTTHMGWGIMRGHPGKIAYQHGECRLLIRSLPPKVPIKKKSDTHQWPKGTFMQVNSKPIVIGQRKQQAHDAKLWKGLCYPLDLTQYITNPEKMNDIQICARDEESYRFQIAVCEYIAPDKLYDLCMSQDVNVKERIQFLSEKEALDKAAQHLNKAAVVLDDDSDDGDGSGALTDVTLTFSLLCKMSMVAIQTPVRGKNCKHMQCFDLRNYLKTNATVSGGRWRCGVCEDFVPVKDLVVDGMMLKILDQCKGKISGVRDKIQLRKDGSWTLMEANKLRYGKKRPAEGDSQAGGSTTRRLKSEKTFPPVEEIIDLDD